MRKPAYTSEELTAAVDRVERLSKMQAQALQNYRLLKEEHYNDSYKRLTENVKTSQLVYQAMLSKLLQK